jgi:SRSO17 transposase
MAVSCDATFTTPTGPARADDLAALAPKRGWQRLSAGEGSKGQRLYDWLLVDPGAGSHLLLVRRSISKPTELAYYICHSTQPAPLAELVRVAGSRRGVEETFQFAKNETGLDHYQVRKYDAWYRHITLSMLAAAFLAVTAHTERARDQKRGTATDREELIPLSCNEIRRLWVTLTHSKHPEHHTDHWSLWRLRHQTRARRSHYQRQRLKYNTLRL